MEAGSRATFARAREWLGRCADPAQRLGGTGTGRRALFPVAALYNDRVSGPRGAAEPYTRLRGMLFFGKKKRLIDYASCAG
jgi:hypothetical protein